MKNIAIGTHFQRKYPLITGVALILMAIAAAFSYSYVLESLVDKGDATSTFENIVVSSALFNAGIFGWLVIFICDVVVAWALYLFLQPINKNLSLLGALFRLTYAVILGVSLLNLIFVSILTSGTDYSFLLNDQQLSAFTLLFIDAFHYIWSIGLVIFGGHLLVIGYLSFQSKQIPKIISLLLIIAAFGYIAIHLFSTFYPHLNVVNKVLIIVFSVPMTVGELGLGFWLLIRGGKQPIK